MMQNMASGARRFRRGLPVEPVEVDGYKFFEVQRPDGGAFRLYDFEHLVALELNGQPLEEVVRAAQAKHGLTLTELQVMAFVDRLGELDLLEPEVDPESEAPDATLEHAPALSADSQTDEDDDDLADEPTTDHGRVALHLMAASMAAKQNDAAPQGQRVSSWHEAEPTSLMGSMGDLLAVSRARTGESDVFVAPPQDAHVAVDEDRDQSAYAMTSAADMGTREMLSAGAQLEPFIEREPLSVDEPAALAPPQPPQEAGETRPPRRLWIWALVAVALAASVGFAVFRFVIRPTSAPLSVDTILPSPVAAYRWFETAGQLQAATAATLSIPAGGKLIELRDVGASFSAGDTLAATEDAKRVRKDIDHLSERIAYYQQMLEAMTAEGNRTEARQAEIKLKEKQQLLDDARRAYAQVAIVATTSGVVGQHLAKVNDKLSPQAPVMALAAQHMRGVFQLSREDAEQAQRLAFCRALVNEKPFDCTFLAADDAETVVVELPAEAQAEAGVPVQLARARFDGVFAVPATAVVQVGNTDRIFVATPTGRAEVRAVALADRTANEVLVAQGLDVGDAVIVEVPHQLAPNAQIKVNARVLQ